VSHSPQKAKASDGDYTVTDQRFRVTVNAAARKRGMAARTKLIKEGVVAFQAVPTDKPSEATPAA
jgi:hypothetical protein